MRTRYAALLRDRTVRAFVAAGLVGRLPASMMALAIVLLVRDAQGSYAFAGGLAGVIAISMAVAAPPLGRLFDRFGQHRVLVPLIAFNAVASSSVVLAIWTEFPRAPTFALAGVAGATSPHIGPLVRARWAHILRDRASLQTAYALESVMDEVALVLGPVLVTAAATTISPLAGPLLAIGCALIGGASLAMLRSTEPPNQQPDRRVVAAIRTKAVQALVPAFFLLGFGFGTFEVAIVAFAEEQGEQAAAGALLGAYALASGVAGIVYGMVAWRSPLDRRLVISIAILCVSTVPIALADSLATMFVAVVVCGATNTPVFIAAYGIVQSRIAPSALTEGFNWLATSVIAGAASGFVVVGHVVDSTSGHVAMRLFIATTAGALAVVTIGRAHISAPVAASS